MLMPLLLLKKKVCNCVSDIKYNFERNDMLLNNVSEQYRKRNNRYIYHCIVVCFTNVSSKYILHIFIEFKHVPNKPEYSELTTEDFKRPDIQLYVKRELEVTSILDYLYEWSLIDLLEYEQIEKATSRIEKVCKLLSILQQSCDSSWTSRFSHILNNFGHQKILREMLNIKNPHQIKTQGKCVIKTVLTNKDSVNHY